MVFPRVYARQFVAMNYVLSSRQSFVVNQRSLSTRLDERDDGLFSDSHPGSKNDDKGALQRIHFKHLSSFITCVKIDIFDKYRPNLFPNLIISSNPFFFSSSSSKIGRITNEKKSSSKRNVTNDRGQSIIAR